MIVECIVPFVCHFYIPSYLLPKVLVYLPIVPNDISVIKVIE